MGVWLNRMRRHGRALTFIVAICLGVLLVGGAALGAQGSHPTTAAVTKARGLVSLTGKLTGKPVGKLQHAPTNLRELGGDARVRAHDSAVSFPASSALAVAPAAFAAPAAAALVAAPPAAPVITAAPTNPTYQTSATFRFSSSGATSYQCRLDLIPIWLNCSSPRVYSLLPYGTQTFRVRARNSSGTGPEQRYSWTINRPPAPVISSAPANPTLERTASFTFSSIASGVSFECRLDQAAYAACTSPKTYSSLAVGSHTFRVRARTFFGSGAETLHTWTIGAVPVAKPVKMRLLVVSADGKETDFPALKAFLAQLGVPYTTMIATESDLTAGMLSDGQTGNFQGVILTTGNLTHNAAAPGEPDNWISAFSPEEWQTLWAYEAEYKVRQVTSFTFPYGLPDDYGLNLDTYQDTLATPLEASLTDAGKSVFPYLNTASPITFKGAWVYLATKRDASVTPLLTTANGYVVASTNSYSDGRENLAVTAANNPFLLHSELLSYGLVNWVTRGVFLGERHVNLDVQVDDLFIDSEMWDVDANTELTGHRYRLDADDFANAIAWQNAIRSRPGLSEFRLEFAFNGEGTDPSIWEGDPLLPNGDTLTPAVRAGQANFSFVNHTYSHENLDLTNYDTALAQITLNQQVAATLGLTHYDPESFVQPDVSGLTNASFLQAAFDRGIRYLISDASRPEWANPSPNAGFYATGQPEIFIAPRRANNLFFSLRTPEEWTDEYNWFYWLGSPSSSQWKFWADPQTFEQIMDHESDNLLSYMLRWDLDPWMFHQANLGGYDGARTLLGDLLGATFDKYASVYNLPVRNVTEKQAGQLMKQRMGYDASGVEGTLVPCQSITLSVTQSAVVPLTGVATGASETYGGQAISSVPVSAGTPQTIPVSC